jgi:hypothetical protein
VEKETTELSPSDVEKKIDDLPTVEKEIAELSRLQDVLTLNPIAAVPRLTILFAGLTDSPKGESQHWEQKQYWPSSDAFEAHKSSKSHLELRWAQCWYKEAIETCNRLLATRISHHFNHACAAFYFTLMSLDRRSPICETAEENAMNAFRRIELNEESLPPAQYMKAGFYGIYQLATKNEPKEALDQFRQREGYSQVTGSRFALLDHLFSCCHAVAAQRVSAELKPEVDYYLAEARNAAGKHPFYMGLYEAARAEVSKERGKKVQPERQQDISQLLIRMGIPRYRILQIFQRRKQQAKDGPAA